MVARDQIVLNETRLFNTALWVNTALAIPQRHNVIRSGPPTYNHWYHDVLILHDDGFRRSLIARDALQLASKFDDQSWRKPR